MENQVAFKRLILKAVSCLTSLIPVLLPIVRYFNSFKLCILGFISFCKLDAYIAFSKFINFRQVYTSCYSKLRI